MGEQKTEQWLRGVVANLARSPKGGDTDQIKGVASGECAIAVTNSYYLARIMRSDAPENKAIMDRVGVVFPNQSSWGTHVNVAGGAVARNAKNPANAVKFLEYLASAPAQNHFANGNNEWPAAKGVEISNPALKAMTGGDFKSETMPDEPDWHEPGQGPANARPRRFQMSDDGAMVSLAPARDRAAKRLYRGYARPHAPTTCH
jgi:iron(III) transport system substrate-binding protein